jgi:uncharacterized membrane protein (UPF0136 family)
MGAAMTEKQPRSPRSAGIALAILPIVGAFVGGLYGQPSIGLLTGVALGAALALLVWAIDRRR